MKKKFEDYLEDLFFTLNAKPNYPVQEIKKKVLILSTARTGSSLFCDVLRNTDQLGNPHEWFHDRFRLAHAKHFDSPDVTTTDYLDFLYRKTTTENGIFSLKLHIFQHIELLKNKVNLLSLGFDRIYYIYRKDKMTQAYSLAKAMITDEWSSHHRPLRNLDGHLPILKVIRALQAILQQEHIYAQNLHKFVDREFCYEDFQDLHAASAFRQVLVDMEVDLKHLDLSTNLTKQRSTEDQEAISKIKEFLFPTLIARP